MRPEQKGIRPKLKPLTSTLLVSPALCISYRQNVSIFGTKQTMYRLLMALLSFLSMMEVSVLMAVGIGLRRKRSVVALKSSMASVSSSKSTIWLLGMRLLSLNSYEKFSSSSRSQWMKSTLSCGSLLSTSSILSFRLRLRIKDCLYIYNHMFGANFLGVGGRNVLPNRPGGNATNPMPPRVSFFRELRVYPASFAFREDIEKGDKILLPSSALNELYHLISSKNKDPMIFCIKNGNKMTYCGVLEFVAEEGLCYIPNWMFKMLKFPQPGSPATVALVGDMRKKYGKIRHMIKLQPHQTKFIDMENPKAILEYQLRNFTCLHEGDTISIQVFNDKFEIDILEITPKNEYNAICIIDADVDVDFAPPLDYVEPQKNTETGGLREETKKGGVFGGNGVRIDEKAQTGNARKGSSVQPQEEEYDPRKHRIYRGVRKTSVEWTGTGVKIGQPTGTKK